MSYPLTYICLVKPVLEKYPREGEMAIRQGLRAFGKFRGERLKKWHQERGLPINMYSLIEWWDLGSGTTFNRHGLEAEKIFKPIYTAYRVVYPWPDCDLYTECKENNFEHYGYIYCDEIHNAVCQAYHPDATVEIHENLMKNDPYCHFTWLMPPEIPEEQIDKSGYERMKKWEQENPNEEILLFKKRDAIQSGILYYFLAKAIIDRFGNEGKKMVESSLIEMGKRRGKKLKWKLAYNKIPLSVKNVFDNFDLAYKDVWDMKINDSEGKVTAHMTYCPLAEVWHELNDTEIGSMYCKTQYDALCKELSSEAEVNLLQTMAAGACKCVLEFKI